MKIIVSLVLWVVAGGAAAQDYYWLQRGSHGTLPERVVGIDVTDRTGDWRDYRATGLPMPATLPALVDATSGDMVCAPTGTVKQAIRQIRAGQREAVTNESPTFFHAFTFSTNTTALIGTNRAGYALLRFDGTKLTAAQREQYQTDCIQYLAARLQLIERELKRKRLVDVKSVVEETGAE
jgi:hypothetical protein